MTQTEAVYEEDLMVTLTFHNFSAEMLREFAQKIVKPYFRGNMNEAVRCLMQKAIDEEALTMLAIKRKRK
jgi:hypothetical protein